MKQFRGDSEKVRKRKRVVRPLHASQVNLAESLSEEDRDAIAALIWEDYVVDEESRSDWLRMHAEWLTVYHQMDKPMNPPWQGSSEESLGLLTEACNQFQARTMKAFFPHRAPITALPTGESSAELVKRAKRIGRHISWQLMVKTRGEYKRDKSALFLSVPLHGSCFTKTYFDPVKNKNVVRNVRAEDLVVNYRVGPIAIGDVERKTEIVWTSVNDTRKRTEAGYFLHPAEPYIGGDQRPTTKIHDQAQGTQPAGTIGDDACILEQHRLIDLDGDGVAEPYIGWVDAQSQKLMRLEIRYQTDAGGMPINAKEPIEQYTHYGFLANPDGFYSLGLGHLIGKGNIAINKLLRQFIDAATLANVGNLSGFISQALASNKGEVSLEMGKFKSISASTEDIQKGIKTMSFPPPNNAIPETIKTLDNRFQRISSVTDLTAGESEKVLQPTTVASLIEQSQMLFSSVQDFLLISWGEELQKVFDLNKTHMAGQERFTLRTPQGEKSDEVSPEDYQGDMEIVPIADPRLANQQQRMQRANFLYQFSSTNPLIAQRPEALLKASRAVLEAMEIDDIDEYLPEDPAQLKMPEPPPDPKVVAAQMQAQIDTQRMQLEHQRSLAEAATRAKIDQERQASDHARKMAEIAAATEQARIEADMKLQVEREKLAMEERMQIRKLEAEIKLEEKKIAADMRMAQMKCEADARAKVESALVTGMMAPEPEGDKK